MNKNPNNKPSEGVTSTPIDRVFAAIGSQEKSEEHLGVKSVKFFAVPNLRKHPFKFFLQNPS